MALPATACDAPPRARTRVLIVEDSRDDAALIMRQLRRDFDSITCRQVDGPRALEQALKDASWDAVVCDYQLPGFDARAALDLVRRHAPDLPFVVVSGKIGEEAAIELLKAGAGDCVMKHSLQRLAPALRRELEARGQRRRHVEAELALRESDTRFRQLAENIHDVFFLVDAASGRNLYVNPAYEEIWGRSCDSLRADPQAFSATILPAYRAHVIAEMQAVVDSNRTSSGEYRIERPDGSTRWVHARAYPIVDASGKVVRIAAIASDVTERKRAEYKIQRLNRVYAVLSGINGAIIRGRDRRRLYEEACRIAVEQGQFADALIVALDPQSARLRLIMSACRDKAYQSQLKRALAAAEALREHYERLGHERQPWVTNDLEREPDSALLGPGRVIGARAFALLPLYEGQAMVAAFGLAARETGFFDADEMKLLLELAGDISFSLEHIRQSEQLDTLAYYEPLTGLANARLFRERLAQQLRATADKTALALVLIDVERFKWLNDALGRDGGDLLLKQLAERLERASGNPSKVGHLGRDNFAVMLPAVQGEAQLRRELKARLEACFAQSFSIRDIDYRAGAKLGVALYPADGADAESLMANAEAALKKAKNTGERCLFYSSAMNARVAERLVLESRLRQAVRREEFVLHYQPRMARESGRLAGVEALIRWSSPDGGLVAPGEFVPLLEESGLILEVGAWALARAVEDHRRWRRLGLAAPPRISVNVSAIQLHQADFVDTVRKAIEGDDAPGIDLEITESLIMEDVERNIAKLEAIRELGLGIFIDDFGTGYSSLAYLARLPVHAIKIDRSFIITMLDDTKIMTLVSTIISLGHSLDLKVVAEGVDQEEQAKVLRLLRCDELQGFLFGKPVPFEDIRGIIDSSPPAKRNDKKGGSQKK